MNGMSIIGGPDGVPWSRASTWVRPMDRNEDEKPSTPTPSPKPAPVKRPPVRLPQTVRHAGRMSR